MYTDIFGNTRIRLGLHHHTTLSDGRSTPELTAQRYKEAGYDAIAFTDHWVYGNDQTLCGFPILAGGEYHTGFRDGYAGVYHIVCLCAEQPPILQRDMTPQQVIDGIHEAGGLAILAHPAWSMNSPEKIKSLKGIDAIEIYNTVSERGNSRRADASLIIDMLAAENYFFPLLAADDSHYYEESGNFADSCNAFIMAQCNSVDPIEIKKAILEKRFYASTGPEIHLSVNGNIASVDCSEATEIVFMSNFVITKGRVTTGEKLTHADYEIQPGETFLRAYVTDKNGRQAWTNCIKL